jgi:SAM-dependent methyltransferase
MTRSFYDELAPYYHLIYPDWDASIARQARGLAAVLEEFGIRPGAFILDAACGVGTQTLGLATLGYRLSASDIAPAAVARAEREAEARQLRIDFRVADLRQLSRAFSQQFAAVIACDNALPHLLSDDEIRGAAAECRRCLAPGGVFIASVRDYAKIPRRTPHVHPYGERLHNGRRYSVEQLWEWDGDQYDLTMRLTEEKPDGSRIVHDFRSRYYAIELPVLERLLLEAGFARVVRRDEHFFQPLLVAVNAEGERGGAGADSANRPVDAR